MGADRSLAVRTETTGGVALRRDASPLDFRVRAWYDPPGGNSCSARSFPIY